jgi:hypothetical protein
MGENGAEFAVSHSKYSLERLKGAGAALGLLEAGATEFSAYVTQLTQTAVSARQWARFLDRWVPFVDEHGHPLKPNARTLADKKRETLQKLWIRDPRVSPWAGTGFGVVQAVNTFTHHETRVTKGGDRGERNTMWAILGNSARVDAEARRLLDSVLQDA